MRIERSSSEPTLSRNDVPDVSRRQHFTTIDDSAFDRIFKNEILKDSFRDAKPSENPRFVLLVGQPGAGKTVASNIAKETFGEDGCVRISNDTLMTYHPNYHKLTTTGCKEPFKAKEMRDVFSFSDKAKQRLFTTAAAERYNIIFENVFANGAANEKLPKFFDGHINDIELWVVATPHKASSFSNYVRYESQRADFEADPDLFRAAHKDGPRISKDSDMLNYFNQFRNSMTNLEGAQLAEKIRGVKILDREGVRFETDSFEDFSGDMKKAFLNLVDREISTPEKRAIFEGLPHLSNRKK